MLLARFVVIALLLGTTTPAFAAAGDSIDGLRQLIEGPIFALLLVGGSVATVFFWYSGKRTAMWFGFIGLAFLATAKAIGLTFYGAGGPIGWGSIISVGQFPVYGDDPAVASPSGAGTSEIIRSWALLGVLYLSNLTYLGWTKGAYLLVFLIAAAVTYKRIVYDHKIIDLPIYFVKMGLITATCCVPLVSFSGKPPTAVEQAIDAAATAKNATLSVQDTTQLVIPILPALVLTTATDIAQSIGSVLVPSPAGAYARTTAIAARSSELTQEQNAAFSGYSYVCGASGAGMRFYDQADGSSGHAPAQLAGWSPVKVSETAATHSAGKDRFAFSALSPWGDLLLYGVPAKGYAASNSSDIYTANFLPDGMSAAVTDGVRVPVLDRKVPHDFVVRGIGMPTVATVRRSAATPSGLVDMAITGPTSEVPYTKPIQWATSVHSTTSEAILPSSPLIPYCVIPGDGAVKSISISRADDKSPWLWDDESLANSYQLYIANRQPAIKGTSSLYQRIYPVSEQVRTSVLAAYSDELCGEIAKGDPANSNYWGCLVSGGFARLPAAALSDTNHPQHEAAAVSAWFWGSGSTIPQGIIDEIRRGADATVAAGVPTALIPTRATAVSAYSELKTKPAAQTTIEVRRTTIDLLFAGSGISRQVGLGKAMTESGPQNEDPKGESDGALSWIFSVISKPIQLIVWLMGFAAEAITYVVAQLWPHFFGITMLLVLVLFAVVSVIALWRWTVLLDWTMGAIWVCMWWLPMALGMALINAASDSRAYSILTGTDPPASGTLRIVGGCLVMMSPVIMQAFIFPGFDAIAKLGGAVYGTGFKIVGAAAQIAALAGGVTAGVVGAAVGGVAGAAASAGQKPGVGGSDNTKGASSAEAQTGGRRGSGGEGPTPSKTITTASRAASFGQAVVGGNLSKGAAMVSMGADMMGANGMSSGSSTGAGMADVGNQAVRETGAGLTVGARIAARNVGNAAERGSIAADGKLARVAGDVARGTGGIERGTAIGALMGDGGGGLLDTSGDSVTSAKLLGAKQAEGVAGFRAATASGDREAAIASAKKVVATGQASAEAARRRGDHGAAVSALSAVAEGEVVAFEHGGQQNYQRVTEVATGAIKAGEDLERLGIATSNQGWIDSGRAAQTKGHEYLARAHARQSALQRQQGDEMVQQHIRTAAAGPDRRQLTEEQAREELSLPSSVEGREYRQNQGEVDDLRRQAGFHAQQAMQGYSGAYAAASKGYDQAVTRIKDAAGGPAQAKPAAVQAAVDRAVQMGAVGAQADGLASAMEAMNVRVEVPNAIQRGAVQADLARTSGNQVADQVSAAVQQNLAGNTAGASAALRVAGAAAPADLRVRLDAAGAALAAPEAANWSPVQRQAILASGSRQAEAIADAPIARSMDLTPAATQAEIGIVPLKPKGGVVSVEPPKEPKEKQP